MKSRCTGRPRPRSRAPSARPTGRVDVEQAPGLVHPGRAVGGEQLRQRGGGEAALRGRRVQAVTDRRRSVRAWAGSSSSAGRRAGRAAPDASALAPAGTASSRPRPATRTSRAPANRDGQQSPTSAVRQEFAPTPATRRTVRDGGTRERASLDHQSDRPLAAEEVAQRPSRDPATGSLSSHGLVTGAGRPPSSTTGCSDREAAPAVASSMGPGLRLRPRNRQRRGRTTAARG